MRAGACTDRETLLTSIVFVGERKPSKVDHLAVWCRRRLDDNTRRPAVVVRTSVHEAHDLLSRDRWGSHCERRTRWRLHGRPVCALGLSWLALHTSPP